MNILELILRLLQALALAFGTAEAVEPPPVVAEVIEVEAATVVGDCATFHIEHLYDPDNNIDLLRVSEVDYSSEAARSIRGSVVGHYLNVALDYDPSAQSAGQELRSIDVSDLDSVEVCK